MKHSNVTLKDVERWHLQGRGVGTGYDYTPWLKTRDVPSTGRSRRLRGLKTGRIHHLLSDLEYKHFLMLEFSDCVVDIREQYPLFPLDQMLGIAEALSLPYPTFVGTSTPYVLTTDLLVTYKDHAGNMRLHARTIKYKKDLEDKLTLEHLELERVYWEIRGASWDVGTEDSINNTLFKNLNWLRFRLASARQCHEQPKLPSFVSLLLEACNQPRTLRELLELCSEGIGIPYATAILWFKFLAWRRIIPLDLLNRRLLLYKPIELEPVAEDVRTLLKSTGHDGPR